jgi:large subunit ribosomal protein L11
MAKEIQTFIKLQVKGGQANPAPPIGPALGSKGINIMEFCKKFNAQTQDKIGKTLPVVITVYTDKSFEFIIKTPPVHSMLMELTKKQAGSAEPNRKKIGTVSKDIIRTIAEAKMPDLNCFTIESAMSMVAGSAKSAGFNVEGY